MMHNCPSLTKENLDLQGLPSLDSEACESCRRAAHESLETQLILKLQEYSENRSITSVVPVENPLASDEPELLEMSPEEAEGTQL